MLKDINKVLKKYNYQAIEINTNRYTKGYKGKKEPAITIIGEETNDGSNTNIVRQKRLSYTAEMCPYCGTEAAIPNVMGIYECPECKHFIISCSICEPDKANCGSCKFQRLLEGKEN